MHNLFEQATLFPLSRENIAQKAMVTGAQIRNRDPSKFHAFKEGWGQNHVVRTTSFSRVAHKGCEIALKDQCKKS